MNSDQELADVLALARKAKVVIHVRGTDKHPVIDVRNKLTGQQIGGSELKRRLQETRS